MFLRHSKLKDVMRIYIGGVSKQHATQIHKKRDQDYFSSATSWHSGFLIDWCLQSPANVTYEMKGYGRCRSSTLAVSVAAIGSSHNGTTKTEVLADL